MARIERSALIGRRPVWLLTLRWAGSEYRFSTQNVEPIGADGAPVPYPGGMEGVEFGEAFELLTESPDLPSVPVELIFSEDVALRIAQGHDLGAASAELALWVDGLPFERRWVAIDGVVTQPEYGAAGDPVTFSIESLPWTDQAVIPAAAARVTEKTWPTHPDSSRGLYYPVVFGAPGPAVTVSGSALSIPATPTLIVTLSGSAPDKLVVAGHRVAAAQVTISDGSTSTTRSITHEADGLGRTVATVDLSGSGLSTLVSEYWAIWTHGGGAERPDRTGAIQGAGEVMRYFLDRSSLTVDDGRLAAAAQYLDRIRVAGYLDEPVTPWDWISGNLLPLLPVTIRAGPGGVYPIIWRPEATAIHAVDHIDTDRGASRISPVSYLVGRDRVVNDLRIRFALDADGREHRQQMTIRSAPDPDDPDDGGSHHAAVSASRYGVSADEFDTDIIYDRASAGIVLHWMIRAKSSIPRSVTYRVGTEYGWLSPGAILSISDPSIYLDQYPAVLAGVTWTAADGIDLLLILIDDPPRDSRLFTEG